MIDLSFPFSTAKKAVLKGLTAARRSSVAIAHETGGHDVTTKADLSSSKAIITFLASQTPDIPILCEETGQSFDPESTHMYWVVDPVDGSNNRERGFPYWSVSVSLVVNNEVVVAVVGTYLYDGEIPTIFAAMKGSGMTRNGQRAYARSRATFVGATVCFDNSYSADQTHEVLNKLLLLHPSPWFKNFGSAVLTTAEVAAGMWDAHYHWAFKPWDIAAALLFFQEVGGSIIDLETGKTATLKTTKAVCGGRVMVDLLLEQIGLAQ